MSEPMSLIRTTGDAIVNLAAKNALISQPQPDDYLWFPTSLSKYPYQTIASKYADKYWSWNYASGVIRTIYALDHDTSYSGMTKLVGINDSLPSDYNFTSNFGGQVANGSVAGSAFNDGVLRKSTLDALLVDMQRLGRFCTNLPANRSDWTMSGTGKYTFASIDKDEEVITKNFTNKSYSESVNWTTGYGFHVVPSWMQSAQGLTARATRSEWTEELVTTSKCQIALPFTIATTGAMLFCEFNCEQYSTSGGNNDKSFGKFYPLTVGSSGRSIPLPAFDLTELESVKDAVYPNFYPSRTDSEKKYFNVYLSSTAVLIFNMA